MRQLARWRKVRHWFRRVNCRYGCGLFGRQWRRFVIVVAELALSILIVYAAAALFQVFHTRFEVKEVGGLVVDKVNFGLCGAVALVSFLLLGWTLIRWEQILSDPRGQNYRWHLVLLGQKRTRRSFWEVMKRERRKLLEMLQVQLLATVTVIFADTVFHKSDVHFTAFPLFGTEHDLRSLWLCAAVALTSLLLMILEIVLGRCRGLHPRARRLRRVNRIRTYRRKKRDAEEIAFLERVDELFEKHRNENPPDEGPHSPRT